jgi:hypothetical protein
LSDSVSEAQLLGVSHMGEAGAFKAEMLAEYIPREHRVVVQDFRSEVCFRIPPCHRNAEKNALGMVRSFWLDLHL